MWRLAAISYSNDGSRFWSRARPGNPCDVINLARGMTRDEERMDERHQHLIAAAEAMRTWAHKQRSMWAEGYPQSLRQPQFAAAGAVAIVSPSAFMAARETPPA